jgi:hypothetical protein
MSDSHGYEQSGLTFQDLRRSHRERERILDRAFDKWLADNGPLKLSIDVTPSAGPVSMTSAARAAFKAGFRLAWTISESTREVPDVG